MFVLTHKYRNPIFQRSSLKLDITLCSPLKILCFYFSYIICLTLIYSHVIALFFFFGGWVKDMDPISVIFIEQDVYLFFCQCENVVV